MAKNQEVGQKSMFFVKKETNTGPIDQFFRSIQVFLYTFPLVLPCKKNILLIVCRKSISLFFTSPLSLLFF